MARAGASRDLGFERAGSDGRVRVASAAGTGPYFLDTTRSSELGPDGHPQRGDFMPPVQLPRRMWAGSRLEFLAPLELGESAKRVSRILAVEEKSGRSGRLCFVTVEHEIHGRSGVAIREQQDIVYRDAATGGAAGPATGAGRCDVAARVVVRCAAPVQILRADLQQPPHPLRPRVCDERRGLPGTRGARTAARNADARTGARASSEPSAAPIRIPRGGPCVRKSSASKRAAKPDGDRIDVWIRAASGSLHQRGSVVLGIAGSALCYRHSPPSWEHAPCRRSRKTTD